MAGLFGHRSSNVTAQTPIDTALRIQTSIAGRPIPIGAGKNRFSGNMIWYGDFYPVFLPQPKAGGKGGVGGGGGKGSSGGYTVNYYVSAIVSIADGEISGIPTVYNGASVQNPGTYGATVFYGTRQQTEWSYTLTKHLDQALSYREQSYVAFASLSLGQSSTFPSFSWEVVWKISGSAGSPTEDVNPADWIVPFLSDERWGVLGWSSSLIGEMTEYSTFCRAHGLFISPVLTEFTSAQSHLGDIMTATASDFVWSGGKLSVRPYVRGTMTGNGVTYSPDISPVYYVDENQLIATETDGSYIQLIRKDPLQINTRVALEYQDRSSSYNSQTIYATDESASIFNGQVRQSSLRTHHFFCTSGSASTSSYLQLAREKATTTISFTLPSQYILVDPLDILAIKDGTSDFFADYLLVIVTEIQENSDGTLAMTAEVLQSTSAPSVERQTNLGTTNYYDEDPGSINPPLLFEPPSSLATSQVWMVVSGSNTQSWGGAYVWVSTDDVTYTRLADPVQAGSAQGYLSQTLPSVPLNVSNQTVDSTNILSVDLTESSGSLATGSYEQMTSLVTLCYVDGELLSYETAALSGTNRYSVTTLVRGAYGSSISSHVSGSQFARLDSHVLRYSYPAGLIGKRVYVKFQSFNIYGGGIEDISSLPSFSVIITGGLASRVDTYNNISIPSGGLTVNFDKSSGTGTPIPFTGGPNTSPVPYVSAIWNTSSGDILSITNVTLSNAHIQITNAGTGVARTATVTVNGY